MLHKQPWQIDKVQHMTTLTYMLIAIQMHLVYCYYRLWHHTIHSKQVVSLHNSACVMCIVK
jgi:hypothetical protein